MKELLRLIKNDEKDFNETLHLTAYENRLSPLAKLFLNSDLSTRQYEGPHPYQIVESNTFIYKNLIGMNQIGEKAIEVALDLLQAEYLNLGSASGMQAMINSISCYSLPDDIIYSISPIDGGHASTQTIVNQLSRYNHHIPFEGINIDLDKLKHKFEQKPANIIYLDHGTPLEPIKLAEIRKLTDAFIIYDASHTLGLIAGDQFQQPLLEGADVLQGSLHKSFPGPQKALISSLKPLPKILNKFTSNQHAHHCLAAYITILEMEQFGKDYAIQMLKNARILNQELRNQGFDTFDTKTHQILIKDIDSFENAKRLINSNISVNARIAYQQAVIRLGTQEVTRRGMKEDEMKFIASFIKEIILDKLDITEKIIEFNKQFKKIEYCYQLEDVNQ